MTPHSSTRRALLAKRRITDDAAGYRLLLELLAEHGDTPQDPIPVAIETSHGILVATLRTGSRRIYAVNPLSAARYRDRHAVSRKKSDHCDAMVLANILRSYRQEATRRTGWPATRWLVRFRPDPLRRLNLRRDGARPELNRTSLPPAGAPERARTDAAVREFAEAASDGAPGPWRAVIRGAAREGRDRLPDALDQAIAATDLNAGRTSWWWTVFNVIQWLALLTALGGFGWLGVLAALGYLQLPVPEVPRVQGWPIPTVMTAGGVLLGIVLAMAAKFIAGAAARSRGAVARKRLKSAVAAVAEELVVEPVELEVSRLASFNRALAAARQGPGRLQ